VPVRPRDPAAFDVADRPHGETGAFGELFLGEARGLP